MKQGRTIIQLCTELERQRLARKDFITDTRNLAVQTKRDNLVKLGLPNLKHENMPIQERATGILPIAQSLQKH